METDPEFLRHDARVSIDRGNIIFAHRKQRPQPRVGIQRVTHLLKETTPLLPMFGIRSKQLLELIKNGDARLGQTFIINWLLALLQKLTQGHLRQLLRGCSAFCPRHKRVENIDVRYLRLRQG